MNDKETIGFIGLGAMGASMAENLMDAGYALRVYNRSPERARPLAERGAAVARRPGEVASPGGIVVSIVADDAALEAVTLGEDGLLGRLGEGGIHLSMSTISPETSRRLAAAHAERGEHYVAAPVFGRPNAAAAGQLLICLSGPAAARERVRPLLDVMGRSVSDFGDQVGAANVVKLAGNFMIMAATEAMAEAYTLAEKNGIARQQIHELFSTTIFGCPIYQNYGRAVAEETYLPAGFRLVLGLKDISLALQTGRDSLVPMPLANLVQERLIASVAKGRAEIDLAGLALEASEAAGLEKRIPGADAGGR